jgi:cyanophycin synthetase
MKVLDLKILRGPNYWSVSHPNLLEVRLDIEMLEEFPTNKIPGFAERLVALIPSLKEHHCSEGHEGGFLERVVEGTWIAHVVEHIAIELQWLAGMKLGYGLTRSGGNRGVYRLIVAYEVEEAGIYAVESAIRIVEHIIENKPYDISEDLTELIHLKSHYGLGVSTASIIAEAEKRNIPCKHMDNGSLFMLGYGANQKRIKASMTCITSGISIDTASDKQETKRLLRRAYIPVPEGELVTTLEELNDAVKHLGYPVVLKPLDANQGKGITTNIRSEEQLGLAFSLAQAHSEQVIVERFIEGYDYRVLVVDHKVIAVAKRLPAMVIGDGRSSIKQLVDEVNKDPRRGTGHENMLTQITIDKATEKLLSEKGLSPEAILKKDERLFLKTTANLSTGGTSEDVTDTIHPENIFLAERISRTINLDICGIDIVAVDLTKPMNETNGAVLEVNACPGLRMHISPSSGYGRNVAAPILDMLFPKGKDPRIPIVAVTGTNGKTTTTRLVAHIARTAGYNVGCTTTDGIYINEHTICKGDCTGIVSTETILQDPLVNFAALECARGGILRSGLGFDLCDVSIITNISEDHLGLDGIHTLRDMARVKSVVAYATKKEGYTILNAEDDEAYFTRDYVDCNVGLFAIDNTNERIKTHIADNGLAAFIEEGYIVICKDAWKTRICKVKDVPLTMEGTVDFQIRNVLAAVLAAYVKDIKIKSIRQALKTFIPSPQFTPGRMNLFKFSDFEILVDYAHNTGAFLELKKFLARKKNYKVGIITGVGDRRKEDIKNIGVLAAGMFDEIIIRHDEDLRGATQEEISDLVIEGIRSVNPTIPLQIISSEKEALNYAVTVVKPGTLICTFTESVADIIDFVSQIQEDKLRQAKYIETIPVTT